jgi:hypothetical protein
MKATDNTIASSLNVFWFFRFIKMPSFSSVIEYIHAPFFLYPKISLSCPWAYTSLKTTMISALIFTLFPEPPVSNTPAQSNRHKHAGTDQAGRLLLPL